MVCPVEGHPPIILGTRGRLQASLITESLRPTSERLDRTRGCWPSRKIRGFAELYWTRRNAMRTGRCVICLTETHRKMSTRRFRALIGPSRSGESPRERPRATRARCRNTELRPAHTTRTSLWLPSPPSTSPRSSARRPLKAAKAKKAPVRSWRQGPATSAPTAPWDGWESNPEPPRTSTVPSPVTPARPPRPLQARRVPPVRAR